MGNIVATSSEEWADRARRHLKAELRRAGVTYEELARRLSEMGLRETKGSVAMKIFRGGYPAWFLFAVMEAIGAPILPVEDLM